MKVWRCTSCKAELPDDDYADERKGRHLAMHEKGPLKTIPKFIKTEVQAP